MASAGTTLKNTAVGGAAGAAAGSLVAPGIGTAIGGLAGAGIGLISSLTGGNPVPQADPTNTQFAAGNGADLTNQLAAQQAASGYQQQAGLNNTSSALYNDANQNFDAASTDNAIANAAQMRGGPQIQSSDYDRAGQLAALGGLNTQVGSLNNNASQLTAMGTQAQGPSAAAAQLQQGQDAAANQALAMAHSGRSIGGGAAALQQAQFANATAQNQTNQAAATARINEDTAYRNSQIQALGGATNALGSATSAQNLVAGQANTIRSGNDQMSLNNANLQQNQMNINNATTGSYLGAAGQQLSTGTSLIGQGVNAQENGVSALQNAQGMASGLQTAQLQANSGTNALNASINESNRAAQTAQTATYFNTAGQGLQAAASAEKQTPTTPVGSGSGATSDANMKKNIVPLETLPSAVQTSPLSGYVYNQPIGKAGQADWTTGAPVGTTASVLSNQPTGPALIQNPVTGTVSDAKTGKQVDAQMGANGLSERPSYAQTMASLMGGYDSSIMQPGNVLWRVPGANAPMATPNMSQNVLDYLNGAPEIIGNGNSGGSAGNTSTVDKTSTTPSPTPLAPNSPYQVGDVRANVRSDVHSKTRIKELEGQLASLGGGQQMPGPTLYPVPRAPEAVARFPDAPAVDLRAAPGFSYEYKDPSGPGAAPGRHVSPMAQDLLRTAAASTVHPSPSGLQVDTGRLSMVNTAAISEQQRRLQALQAQVAALSGGGQQMPGPTAYPVPQAPNL